MNTTLLGILQGFGSALYIHAKEAAEADAAYEAVEYLEAEDVLPSSK